MAKGIYVGASGGYKTGLVQGDIIPKTWTTVTTGTSYKASDGTKLTASGYWESASQDFTAKNACDGDTTTNTQWQSSREITQRWLKIEFPEAVKITKMKIRATFATGDGKQFCKIQGSKNDSTWADLYTSTAGAIQFTELSLSNTDYYKYYRLYSEMNSTSLSFCVYEWQVSEYEGTAYDSSIPNKAHKVKKAYIGVDNKARKIKKGYIGVGGVARPFFSAEQKLVYYGKGTDLSVARYGLVGANVGDYALFTGGYASGASTAVDAYDSSLVKSTPSVLGSARFQHAGASVGDYALFAGGTKGSATTTYLSSVDTYTSSLVKGTASNLSRSKANLAGESVGDYALFAGGQQNTTRIASVDAYNTSLVKNTPSDLSVARQQLTGASTKAHAIFAGGYYSTPVSTVDAYNTNLVRSTPATLSTERHSMAGASTEDYALFASGAGTTATETVEAYDVNLTRSTPTALSERRSKCEGVGVGEYALFSGGAAGTTNYSTVDAYDSKLTRSTPTALSEARSDIGTTKVGDYALFGGGIGSAYSKTVDVYQVI